MDFSEIVIQAIISYPFEENAYVVYRRGGNDCLLVDPGTEPEKMLKFLDTNNLRLVAILVTHGHYDHIGGISLLREVWEECKIYTGRFDKEKLTDPQQNLSARLGFPMTTPEADILLEGGETLEIAGIPIQVRYTPGHSKGHMIYMIPTEPKAILFGGDMILYESVGRTDFPDGETMALYKSIQSQILSLPEDTVIYPGHGEPTTVGWERQHNNDIKRGIARFGR